MFQQLFIKTTYVAGFVGLCCSAAVAQSNFVPLTSLSLGSFVGETQVYPHLVAQNPCDFSSFTLCLENDVATLERDFQLDPLKTNAIIDEDLMISAFASPNAVANLDLGDQQQPFELNISVSDGFASLGRGNLGITAAKLDFVNSVAFLK